MTVAKLRNTNSPIFTAFYSLVSLSLGLNLILVESTNLKLILVESTNLKLILVESTNFKLILVNLPTLC